MSDWSNDDLEATVPIVVDIAMYGGPRAGKTSLLASMYSSVQGETRRAGLDIRRRNPETIRLLDDAEDALARLGSLVAADPTLSSGIGVESTTDGDARRFDFVLHGARVDVAALRFYDFSGEDIRGAAKVVRDGVYAADILLVAINTPAMMEAFTDSDLSGVHLRMNVPDQLNNLLDEWTGSPPALVMLCPIKCERWLHEPDGVAELHRSVHEMYRSTINILERDTFAETTVVLAPVETVGAVLYDGFELYDPTQPPTHRNIVFRWKAAESTTWAPRFNEQPFRWALLEVTRAVDYGTIATGKGGRPLQRVMARIGSWYTESGLPKIRSVEEFWRDQTGLETFRQAAAQLAEGRKLDPPYELIAGGTLTQPLEP